jgi:hypothetical protein
MRFLLRSAVNYSDLSVAVCGPRLCGVTADYVETSRLPVHLLSLVLSRSRHEVGTVNIHSTDCALHRPIPIISEFEQIPRTNAVKHRSLIQ